MKNYKIGDDYDAEWKQVQAFEQKGLTQDAKNVVEQIFAKAEKEKNAGQTIKALLHLYRYDSYTEEQSEQKVVNDLKAKIEAAEYPVKPVLQSILAQAYWQYFNNNRYQILQRTALQNDAKAPDFETWDASRFSREMTDLYMASLADTKKLKTTNINIYDAIISTRNASDDITPSSVLRPTLYDLLAHRALDYFTDDQANITKASDQFEISQTTAFADSKTFSQATFNNSDALSLPYYALLTFQQLVDLHLSRSNPAPLIDAEIKRLKFVKRKSVLDNKNELYVEALKKMYEKYKAASPSTNISYEMAAYYNELGGKYQAVAQNEMFKYDKKKAFDICEAAIAKHPDSKGAKNCKRLRSEIIAKNISFKNEENVKPNVESQVLFTYKNIEKIYGRVILLTESLEKKIKRKNRTEIAKIYANQAAIKSFEYDLPDEKLFLENKTELPVPALEVGKYVLLFSTSSKFSIEKNAITYQRFQVTNLSFLSKAKGAETTIYVRNRFSGVALSNINYTLSQTEYDYKKRKYNTKIFATGKTDTKGTFNLTTPNNGNVEIVLQDGKDTFKSNLYLNRYRNNDAKNASMTFFFTDRSIYRPGQTVFFKGLMLEKYGNKEKYELLPNKTTTVTLFDVNGQKVTEQKFKTNEYGSFNGKFSLPSGVLNGQMRIANENGNQYVSVEEYKRPKFEVTFEPIKGSYKLGETVSAEGLAKAYAGNNITDAKVTYRVVRQARFPYWCWWWRPMPTSPALEITNGTMTTDENGNFKIDFEAIADKTVDKKNKPQYTYTIYADVTDINGETRSKTTSVSVSYTALLASINMADVIDSKAA
ncbi:MAG: MG2 domain-containing protein, partial [Chitinophagales bacterium]